MKHRVAILAMIFLAAACATVSPRSRVQGNLEELGVSPNRAKCLAGELDDRLDRKDLAHVAEFLDNMNRASSAGETLDALLTIDNPRAAAAVASAGIACAFGR
ncbi:MAG: hypothetical protein ACE5FO_12790 [Parvularculaceae bacterium]